MSWNPLEMAGIRPPANEVISDILKGLADSDYGQTDAGRNMLPSIRRQATNPSNRFEAKIDDISTVRLSQLQNLPQMTAELDETQVARLWRSLDRDMNGFFNAVRDGRLAQYVEDQAGNPAPARAPRAQRPASANSGAGSSGSGSSGGSSGGGSSGSRNDTVTGTGATTSGAGAAASTAQPQAPAAAPPPPDPYAFVDVSLGQLGNEPAAAARNLTTGLAQKLGPNVDEMGIDGDAFSANMAEIMQDDGMANALASEMRENGASLKADLENFNPANMSAFMDKYPVLSSALLSSMARVEPQIITGLVAEGAMDKLNDQFPGKEYGTQLMQALFENGGDEAMYEAIQDPRKVQNLLERFGGDGQMTEAGLQAVIADINGTAEGSVGPKSRTYVEIFTSDNPAQYANYMSGPAYAALAEAQPPSGMQNFFMHMIMGSDFDPANPANRGAVAAMSSQFGAIKDAIDIIGKRNDLIVANGGESSLGLSSIGNYIDAVTGNNDHLLAGWDRSASDRWIAAHNMSDAQYYNVETGDISPAPADQPIPDGPGNRDLPRRIETVDPNAAGGFG